MGKYRKRPIVIDATRWGMLGDHTEVEEFPPGGPEVACGVCFKLLSTHGRIKTLESGGGIQVVCPGDWIITGIAGESYPCKNDIFEATYEAVE